jgi:hypothetical protein
MSALKSNPFSLDERAISYEQRQRALEDKVTEAWFFKGVASSLNGVKRNRGHGDSWLSSISLRYIKVTC